MGQARATTGCAPAWGTGLVTAAGACAAVGRWAVGRRGRDVSAPGRARPGSGDCRLPSVRRPVRRTELGRRAARAARRALTVVNMSSVRRSAAHGWHGRARGCVGGGWAPPPGTRQGRGGGSPRAWGGRQRRGPRRQRKLLRPPSGGLTDTVLRKNLDGENCDAEPPPRPHHRTQSGVCGWGFTEPTTASARVASPAPASA